MTEADIDRDPSSEALTAEHEPPSGRADAGPVAGPQEEAVVRPVRFAEFGGSPGLAARAGNLDLLMDVEMKVTVELGRTQMPIREVLPLGPGSIVELDKLAGEPVDILVNGIVVGCGEIVVVEEKFGVRVTEVLAGGRRRKDQ